jgi:hypothetical protein
MDQRQVKVLVHILSLPSATVRIGGSAYDAAADAATGVMHEQQQQQQRDLTAKVPPMLNSAAFAHVRDLVRQLLLVGGCWTSRCAGVLDCWEWTYSSVPSVGLFVCGAQLCCCCRKVPVCPTFILGGHSRAQHLTKPTDLLFPARSQNALLIPLFVFVEYILDPPSGGC